MFSIKICIVDKDTIQNIRRRLRKNSSTSTKTAQRQMNRNNKCMRARAKMGSNERVARSHHHKLFSMASLGMNTKT